MRDLVPIKTLVSEVIKAVGQDNMRIYFSNHSTVSEDNYGVFSVTNNHKLYVMAPVSNHIVIKYHCFREKMYIGEFYVKKIDVKYQKANIFTRGLQGWILIHMRNLFCGW